MGTHAIIDLASLLGFLPFLDLSNVAVAEDCFVHAGTDEQPVPIMAPMPTRFNLLGLEEYAWTRGFGKELPALVIHVHSSFPLPHPRK